MTYSQLVEISKDYNLSNEEVVATIEKVVSDVMRRITSKDADCNIEKGEIYLYDNDKRVIPVSNINKSIIRLIKAGFKRELYLREVLKKYNEIKTFRNMVVGGYISRILSDGSLYVELDDNTGLFGVCKVENQPPKERDKYKTGDYYSFYVNKVIYSSDLLMNIVVLSRTSKMLVVGLLQKALSKRFIEDVKIVCESRMAGIISHVKVNKRIPKECILEVSKELQERIVVKYQQNNKKTVQKK